MKDILKDTQGKCNLEKQEGGVKSSGEACGAEGMRLIAYYVQTPLRLLRLAFVVDKPPIS